MNEIVVNKTKILTVPDTATKIKIIHEWGDTVIPATTVTDTYNFIPDSIGVHKVIWSDNSATIRTDYYSVALPVISDGEFFDDYPQLEATKSDLFTSTERRVRSVIQNYTSQMFGPFISKTLDLTGDGGDSLELPYRITNLSGVTDSFGSDYLDLVEIAPSGGASEWFLQYKHSFYRYRDIKRDISTEPGDFFSCGMTFSITGDFGWEYVPTEVTDAAKLLIADEFTGATDLRQHGVFEAQLGDFSYKLNADQWGTTGNTQADNLLSSYVIMRIGMV